MGLGGQLCCRRLWQRLRRRMVLQPLPGAGARCPPTHPLRSAALPSHPADAGAAQPPADALRVPGLQNAGQHRACCAGLAGRRARGAALHGPGRSCWGRDACQLLSCAAERGRRLAFPSALTPCCCHPPSLQREVFHQKAQARLQYGVGGGGAPAIAQAGVTLHRKHELPSGLYTTGGHSAGSAVGGAPQVRARLWATLCWALQWRQPRSGRCACPAAGVRSPPFMPPSMTCCHARSTRRRGTPFICAPTTAARTRSTRWT